MKFLKYYILLLSLFSVMLFSCENEDDKVVFTGGTSPVLTVSSNSDLTLEKSKENYGSLQFSWTDPNYTFSNGVNTQDVTYTLEIDTTGSGFTNSKKVSIEIPRDLSKTFNVRDLNTALSGLELKDYFFHPFEFRIKSTLSNNSVPLYSNVVKVNIATYLDVVYPVPDKLYITGAATPLGWMSGGDAPAPSQEFTKINPYTFVIESIKIKASEWFLFVPVYGNWDNKYGFDGVKEKNNPNGDKFKPGGEDIKSPGEEKNYKITVNFKTGKYSFE